MILKFREATVNDVGNLESLALKSWVQYKPNLTNKNWAMLQATLQQEKTYLDLVEKSRSVVCTEEKSNIIGMAFLIPQGNPTEIYENGWSYIRFVTVDPDYAGNGIGKKLTSICIDNARHNKEKVVALHTSELMHAARHIYESLGFRILKEIEPRLGKRYWLYTLDL